MQWSRTPDYVLEHSNFESRNAGHTWECPEGGSYFRQDTAAYYDISAPLFQSHALRYKYTYHHKWLTFLALRTNRLTALELRKLKPSERPTEFQNLIDSPARDIAVHHEEIDKPASWTFWDPDIPKWYEAWQKSEAEGSERK